MKKPTHFGRRPILMQRHDGGLRIIYPDGDVLWTPDWWDGSVELRDGSFGEKEIAAKHSCTARDTQEEAYKASVVFDLKASGPYSAFLGYL